MKLCYNHFIINNKYIFTYVSNWGEIIILKKSISYNNHTGQYHKIYKEKNNKGLRKFFSIRKIKKFELMKDSYGRHIVHPILYLIKHSKSKATFNTKRTFDIINTYDTNYLRKMKKKIEGKMKMKQDFTSINGFLGEIRCYGYLLDCFIDNYINISPVPTNKNSPTPDFEILNKINNEKIYIEVNTKQCNDDKSKKLVNFLYNSNKNLCKTKTDSPTHTRITYLAPFGCYNNDVNINVIRTISAIKQGSKQFSNSPPCILWIDFQSESIDGLIDLNQAEPLWYKKNYGMFSGVIWYGLYGKEGLPIFNSNQFDSTYNGPQSCDIMMDNGLFIKNNQITATIISESRYTLLFENPFSNKQLPIWLLEKIINLPNFNYEHSRIQFPRYDIKQEIEKIYSKIENLAKIPSRSS